MNLIKNPMGCCLLLFPVIAWGQEMKETHTFSMSAQIRPRAEYRNGALSPRLPGQKPAYFINNRARLSMEYAREGLSIKISGQHTGVWGQDPQIDKNGRFVMNEAWARLNLKNHFFAQLGRQTLSYDDERILGGLDWNVAGRYHDALKLGYTGETHQLHLILAFNQNDEKKYGTYYKPGGQPYKNMETLWYHYSSLKKTFNASLLFLNLGLETGDPLTEEAHTSYLQTMGTYLTYRPGSWNLTGTFYYQTGKNQHKQKVSAYMWALRAEVQLCDRWSVFLASDYLSGNDPADHTFKAFDPLYGTHHKFYGGMDYFYASAFNEGFNPGLWDNQAGLAFKPCKNTNLNVNYHYFSTTAEVDGPGKSYKKDLGSEIDFQIDYQLMKDVKLSAGYSFMLGSETMDLVKGGSHDSWQDWGWISININPNILFVKW